MFITVKNFLDIKYSVWSLVVSFVNNKSAFDTLVGSITPLRTVQERNNRGVALDKKNNSDVLINTMLEVKASILAFAGDIKNNTLAKQIEFSNSGLRRLNDTALIGKANLVLEKANENLELLKNDYNLNENSVSALRDAITFYETNVESPRAAVTESSTATKNLSKSINEAKEVLTKLDSLVDTFANKNPDFVTQYYESRKIIDYGESGRSSKAKKNLQAAGPVS